MIEFKGQCFKCGNHIHIRTPLPEGEEHFTYICAVCGMIFSLKPKSVFIEKLACVLGWLAVIMFVVLAAIQTFKNFMR